jgi:hypothetical protein
MDGMAIMARAGHSDFQTTQLYIDLASERFRDEAELLERRLWAVQYQRAVPTCLLRQQKRRERLLRPAGAEGLEPPTPGFGDRCSTN